MGRWIQDLAVSCRDSFSFLRRDYRLKIQAVSASFLLTIFNASASTVVAALSVFAFTQFDFAGRQRTYETKRNAFKFIIYDLKYF